MKNALKNAKIRKILKSDLPAIREIESECFSCVNENFESLIDNENYYYILSSIDDKIVGYGGISIQYEQSDIIYICVKKDYRRKNIATEILKALFSEAKKRGAIEMFLEVNENNTAAINLYLKNGFEQISLRKNYYGKNSAIVMRKTL